MELHDTKTRFTPIECHKKKLLFISGIERTIKEYRVKRQAALCIGLLLVVFIIVTVFMVLSHGLY